VQETRAGECGWYLRFVTMHCIAFTEQTRIACDKTAHCMWHSVY